MKPDSTIAQLTQGAAAWQEEQKHLAVMKELDSVITTEEVIDGDDTGMSDCAGMTFHHYRAQTLPKVTLEEIVKRGNHDEIMILISRYNDFFKCSETRYEGYLPPSVQILLVKRHQKEEIEAVIKHYGFCDDAQKVMFAEWPHEDLVAYTQVHGFGSECQEIMLKTWTDAELRSYALDNSHGFCQTGEAMVIKRWADADIWAYITRHQLSESSQKLLIERGRHEEIMQYIAYHGLSADAYVDIVKRGNHEEIMTVLRTKNIYIPDSKLCFDVILKRGDHDEIMATMRNMLSMNTDEQRLLMARENEEEIIQMIGMGLSNELVEDIFKCYQDGTPNILSRLFACHTRALISEQEKRFVECAPYEEFAWYVIRHSLSDASINTMVEKRSDEEIRYYFENHWTYELTSDAEDKLLEKASVETLLVYYKWNNEAFLHKVLTKRPLNYDFLIKVFVKMPVGVNVDDKEVSLITNGSRDEVTLYISDPEVILCRKAFIALFFRVDTDLFETYLSARTKFYRD